MAAFLSLATANNRAFADPRKATPSSLDRYLIGDAKTLFDRSLFNEKQAKKHYQGTPPVQRVRVVSSNFTSVPKTVLLSSCPLSSTSDPWTEYDAGGKPVPSGLASSVPPPYGKKITVVFLTGAWLVEKFSTDSSETCTP